MHNLTFISLTISLKSWLPVSIGVSAQVILTRRGRR